MRNNVVLAMIAAMFVSFTVVAPPPAEAGGLEKAKYAVKKGILLPVYMTVYTAAGFVVGAGVGAVTWWQLAGKEKVKASMPKLPSIKPAAKQPEAKVELKGVAK